MPLDESQTFFRWAGGKRRLVAHLRAHVPVDLLDRRYREPFLGAGSLFLAIQPNHAILSDLNGDLIATFREVRDRADLISRYLRKHALANSASYYYSVRTAYNCSTRYSAAQAARFIYLNRTCFNGIFRVNAQGAFNVPFGNLANPLLPSITHLRQVAAALAGASLLVADYKTALQDASDGDFIYVDPPYPPLNGTSFFQHYTPERFSIEHQTALAQFLRELADRGCLIMISNADTPTIRKLYRDFRITTIPVTRFVSSKNRKRAVRELVITNYPAARRQTQ